MGGAGGQFTGPASDDIEEKLRAAKEKEEARLKSDVNELLGSILAHYNARDREEIRRRLEVLAEELGEVAKIEKTLYGGSVARHTDIDGISDTDALVVLDIETGRGVSPSDVLERFRENLDRVLPRADVQSVESGRLAVTVTYTDGEEIQLLPAVAVQDQVKIADESGEGWSKIEPTKFERELTEANERAGYRLVPTIKLAKGIVENLPADRQIRSHHLEALAAESIQEYEGPYQPRALLLHVLGYASERVMKPKADVTGQEDRIDEYLGGEGSDDRQRVSLALDGIRRRLKAASSVDEWRKVLNVPDEMRR